MLEEEGILDAPVREENWPVDKHWWQGFLLSTLLLPIMGGLVIYLVFNPMRYGAIEIWMIWGTLILLGLLVILSSGRFLARSPTRMNILLLSVVAIPQATFMLIEMVNTFGLVDAWAHDRLTRYSYTGPDFSRPEDILIIFTFGSIYVPWLAMTIQYFRAKKWTAYLLFAIVYTILAVYLVFGLEVFGRI